LLVAIVGDLRRILLAIVLLDIPFQWDKYLGYREELDQMAALGGWGVSLTTVALVGLYAIWMNFDIFASGTPVALLWVAAAIVASPAMSPAPHTAEVPASARAASIPDRVAVRSGRRAMA
jgi:hypothetical protein